MKKIMSVVFALILVSVLSVSAFAAGSVVADIVKDYDGGTGTYSQNASGTEFTFTADNKDGYNFVGWEIEGNYEIVSGSLDSESVTVRFLDDVTLEEVSELAEPIFEAVDDDVPSTTKDSGKEPGSPDTGDSMAVAFLAVAALGGLVVSKKKLSK